VLPVQDLLQEEVVEVKVEEEKEEEEVVVGRPTPILQG
jgi:hypothetical protein